MGQTRGEFNLLLAFHCYLRISEVVGLERLMCLLPGDAGMVRGALPEISMRKTKTGPCQSVLIEDPLVLSLLGAFVEGKRKEGRLFQSLSEYGLRLGLQQALNRLGVPPGEYVVHSCRHGGAAHDYHRNLRTFEAIKARGRWRSEKSCLIYIQQAKVTL